MQVIHTIAELRERLRREPSIVLVPTMGNLHRGHLTLVELARHHEKCVVVSIFVNRLQFEPGGDFARYPRTLERDCALLASVGCDVVFAPDEHEMYPEPQEIMLSAPRAAAQLCGDFRPGHFQGVVTVVAKLLNIVRPHAAVFGKKDYQQLHVLRTLVNQLNYGVRVIPGPTVREDDGLAMSSRNGYLTPEERHAAVRLNRVLTHIKGRLERAGTRWTDEFEGVRRAGIEELQSNGWKVDYVELRNRHSLLPPGAGEHELVVLGAAWLGRTRLIDNLEVTVPTGA